MGLTKAQKARQHARILAKEMALSGPQTEYCPKGKEEIIRTLCEGVPERWLSIVYIQPLFHVAVAKNTDRGTRYFTLDEGYVYWEMAVAAYKDAVSLGP